MGRKERSWGFVGIKNPRQQDPHSELSEETRGVNLLGVARASAVLYLKGAKLNVNSQGEVRWLRG